MPATARVVTTRDPKATETFRADPARIKAMVNRGICAMTQVGDPSAAWRSLFSAQDIVGIKVYSLPGPYSGTRPAVVSAIVEGLLSAGLPSSNIVVWDRRSVDLRLAGFYDLVDRFGIRVLGAAQAGYDEGVFYENPLLGNLVWGDSEFGKSTDGVGRKSFVSRLVTRQITRIINVSPMLNHNLTGVSGNLFSLALGTVDNTQRFESSAERLATAVPEIYGLPAIADKVALNVVDALICQHEGGERGLLHYSTALNELRFSRDPVALDVLSIRDLDKFRGSRRVVDPIEVYKNAELLELGIADLKKILVEEAP